MPLPRKKDDGASGAPVLNILRAHVRLTDVEEHTEPYTVTRKSDGVRLRLSTPPSTAPWRSSTTVATAPTTA